MWCQRSSAWYNVLDADCIELLSRLPAATSPGGLFVYGVKHVSLACCLSIAGGALPASLRASRRVRRAAQLVRGWPLRGPPRPGCQRLQTAPRLPLTVLGSVVEGFADLPRRWHRG